VIPKLELNFYLAYSILRIDDTDRERNVVADFAQCFRYSGDANSSEIKIQVGGPH